MALGKAVVYGSLALGIVILILVLNFAYLPNRRLNQDFNLSTQSDIDSKRPTISTLTTGNARSFTPKFEDPELSLEDYKTRTWNCSKSNSIEKSALKNSSVSLCYDMLKDPLMCFMDPVHCKHPPEKKSSRNYHWPRYGEYAYLPRSKWPLVMLHGGVVFLYDPCASPELKEDLKALAGSCLHRFVITPYEHLAPGQDFAIVTWGCVHSGKELNLTAMKHWIRAKAMNAPATHVTKTGDFKKGLIQPAKIVSDIHETELCPSNDSKFVLSDSSEQSERRTESDSNQNTKWEEHLSIKENVVIVQDSKGKPMLRHKFDSVNAAWALGSLIFLCLILTSVMMYTRPWRQRDFWWRTDDITYNSNSRFNMLKSKSLSFNWRGNKRRSSAQMRLLGPIPEEPDDDI
ncbi:predicted protein [Nematostella vectensis]|uniref:Uncharacterized protein n=1 Tax=Nematostella vectensis TaxID=45351 RepID=A7RWK4_NEMVE|nr:predicted protein [Nematostella vectensis]|eukprot:XP_001636203.1 predicted protein [Nematostella vectensis]